MIVELGHFALILALSFALLQVILPAVGLWFGRYNLIAMAYPIVWGQVALLVIAFLVLIYAFIVNDFSVLYVANHSHRELPLIFKISAVWGAHEGSLLLWVLILGIWTLLVSLFSRHLPYDLLAQILIVLGVVSIGFLLFMLLTSNPYQRIFPIPSEGNELNPLLQDIALAIHPPMLYAGYTGLAVPFAFVLAALMTGRLDSTWLRWSRPWTLIAWAFLTSGIALGSWWAYYELGWGGWWFWDPVENASFMPWLIAGALVHSLSVAEKRDAFKHWTVLLAICGFSLSLLGTFLVRSGLVTSVHAFANDPDRGVFILTFLALVVGLSLALYAYRAPKLAISNTFAPFSRETGLLINNVFLVTAMLTVLLGTLYPMVLEALNLGKISVGSPYFTAVFVPLMIPVVILLALTPYVRWKLDGAARLIGELKYLWLAIGVFVVGLMFIGVGNIWLMLAVLLFIWVVIHSGYLLIKRLSKTRNLPLAFIGMLSAHIGIGVFALGATMTTQFGIERDVQLAPGQSIIIDDYRFQFNSVQPFSEANYQGFKGDISVFKDGQLMSKLYPEKRQYQTGMPMTEAAIDTYFFNDVYSALGEDLGDGSWSVRLYYKPFVRLIWLGAILIALGALLGALDRRYRLKYQQS